MTEVPCYQIIYLVKRGNRYVQGVRNVLAMKDAARDVALCKDSSFIRQFNLLKLACEFQVARAMRLRHALKLAQDQRRNHRAILRHLVFPPANRQVTTKRLAVIKVSAYDRCFEV